MNDTKDEDKRLLRYAGLMGHEFAGVIGEPGSRRLAGEVNSIAECQRFFADDQLIVYKRSPRKGWHACYDRAAQVLADKIQRKGKDE